MLVVTDNCIITVFSTCIIPRELSGRAELRTAVIPHATWWTKDRNPQESCCGPEGQGCECTTKQHQGSWRRWKHQHNVEYVFVTLVTFRFLLTIWPELYTDESPGLKVDPVVVLVLSIVFIFSVVALHGMTYPPMIQKAIR